MLKNIRGIVSFKACGENIYKFINGIRESSIVCTSQYCKNSFFFGQVYKRDVDRIFELAEEYGINIEITEKRGLRFKAGGYRFRFGIVLGIIIVLGFVFYLSNIVVSIEVCGNSAVTEEQIVSALTDIGIYKGRFIPDINFRSCEQKLRLSIPDIAWTGIRHTGSRIVVDITEAVDPPEMVRDDIPCNIVAAQDAQITGIEVHAGQLVKKIGDGVKKGDIIVSGTVDTGNGHLIKKHAMGKITGIYKTEVTFRQDFEESGQIYTGSQVTKKYFDFFGYRIPLFFKDVDYDTYDYSESTNNFQILGKSIPLGIVHSSYSPFEYDTITYSDEEADRKLQQKTALYEKNFYDSKEIKVIERNIEKKINSDHMEYIVTYSLEGPIGMDYEIYVE